MKLDPDREQHWQRRLTELHERINRRFTPEVMAIDGEDQIVTGAGSQLGWLLWSGAFDEEAATAAVTQVDQAGRADPVRAAHAFLRPSGVSC